MSFVKEFKKEYYQKLLTPHPNNPIRNRADSFLKIFELLEKKHEKGQDFFHIVETGTTRQDHGYLCFGDDGCGTYIFDKFVNFYDGKVLSVDIKQENCDFSNSLTSSLFRLQYLYHSLPQNGLYYVIYTFLRTLLPALLYARVLSLSSYL